MAPSASAAPRAGMNAMKTTAGGPSVSVCLWMKTPSRRPHDSSGCPSSTTVQGYAGGVLVAGERLWDMTSHTHVYLVSVVAPAWYAWRISTQGALCSCTMLACEVWQTIMGPSVAVIQMVMPYIHAGSADNTCLGLSAGKKRSGRRRPRSVNG